MGEVSFKGDGSESAAGSVCAVKEGLRVAKQVGHEVIGLPGAVSAWDVHSTSSHFQRLPVLASFQWSNLASVLLCHVLLHFFIIGIHFLPNRSIDVAEVLGSDKGKFTLALFCSIWCNQGCLIPIIKISNAFVNRGNTALKLTPLVKRWQEWNLFAHLGEFE